MEQYGRPIPSRNTFQRMLDLEKKNKLGRMQALAVVDHRHMQTSTSESKMHAMNHPSALQPQGRAMIVPSFSLSIPQASNTSSNQDLTSQISKHTLVPGGVIVMEETDLSDKSSICHSPGWDDTETRRRRKAKQGVKDTRRRQKEKADMEAKKQKPQKRLTKAPPTSSGTPKPPIPIYRSESTPMVQTLSGPLKVTDKPENHGGKASIDTGPSKFIPWRSAQSTPAEEARPQKGNESFIGGVKLQQSIYSSVQETIRRQETAAVDPHTPKFTEEVAFAELDRDMSTRKLRGASLDSVSPSRQLESSTCDPNSHSSRISGRSDDSRQGAGEYVPIKEKNIKWERKYRASTAECTIQQAQVHAMEVMTETAVEPASNNLTKHGDFPKFSQPSLASSSEGPPITYREPPQLADAEHRRTRRGSFGFMRSQRQSSQARSVKTSQNEPRASTASSTTSTERHSRGRSWSFHKASRSSSSRPATAESVKSNGSKAHGSDQTLITDSRGVPAAPLGRVDSSKKSLQRNRNFSRPIPLQSLKSVAKAAFSRHSFSLKSPPTNISSNETLITKRLQPTLVNVSSLAHLSNSELQPTSKAARPSEESHWTVARNLQDHSSGRNLTDESQSTRQIVGHGNGNLNLNDDAELSSQHGFSNGQNSNSSSLNDSNDEYYSTFDESTSASASAATNPQSEKHSLRIGNSSGGKATADATSSNGSSMVGAAHGRRIIYTMPEDQGKESLPIKSSSCESATNPQSLSNSSKSSSSSDLQTLGVLPTLRHLPLARPSKGKGKEIASTNSPDTVTLNPPINVFGPPPPTPPSSSSSSPISPSLSSSQSAQYLQNARQQLPPSAATSRPSVTSTSSQERNTLAKMFVVCCHCRYFHDMPSKIYECMAKPDNVVTDHDLGVRGVISTAVKCPWCGHGMSTGCCEGWAAVVALRERLH